MMSGQEGSQGSQIEQQRGEQQQSQCVSGAASRRKPHRKQEISNFIMKTYKMLEQGRNRHIIEWMEGGQCFIVKNKDLFENQILPRFFKHRKFSSFVRQLNMYDFHKIRKEKDIPIFKHRQGEYDLLHRIKRKSAEDRQEERRDFSQADGTVKEEGVRQTVLKNRQVSSVSQEIDLLRGENAELRIAIADINREIMQAQLSRDRREEKLMKVLSCLLYLQNQPESAEQQVEGSIRQLQEHFLSEEQPFSFAVYSELVGSFYHSIQQSWSSESQ